MKILLQHKIFIGYFLLMVIIGSMVALFSMSVTGYRR